jgi:hypothetical protein
MKSETLHENHPAEVLAKKKKEDVAGFHKKNLPRTA